VVLVACDAAHLAPGPPRPRSRPCRRDRRYSESQRRVPSVFANFPRGPTSGTPSCWHLPVP